MVVNESAPPRHGVDRERIAQEFDHLGPDARMVQITNELKQHNPELLDMISKCAVALGNPPKVMQALGMFYRLLIMQSWADVGSPSPNLLPRVTPETRDLIVGQIDEKGTEAFTMDASETSRKAILSFCRWRQSRLEA